MNGIIDNIVAIFEVGLSIVALILNRDTITGVNPHHPHYML